MKAGRSLRFAFGAALAVFFIWLILRQISIVEVKNAFEGARLAWLAAALAAFTVGYACRIERWRVMLRRGGANPSWRDCAGPLLAGFAANNVLPFRAGDVLRTFAFGSTLQAGPGVVGATLFVERLLDLLSMILVLGAVLALLGREGAGIVGVGGFALLAAAVMVACVLLFPALFAPVARALASCATCIAGAVGRRIGDEIHKSFGMLQSLAQARTMMQLMLWSLGAWAAEGCVFWFAAFALHPITQPHAAWLALPIGTLSTLIPSTPGYVGTFDYFTVRAMAELGNTTVAATAYALLVHALLWVPATLAGGLYLLLYPLQGRATLATSP